MSIRCTALLVAGCASGQGKTTATAALARYHARAGRKVSAFKTGPDFIDPTILEAASGRPVYNLDCWMVGLRDSRALLSAAARQSDLILVEGAMGLYDGEPSAADLAESLGLPVAAVIDAAAMAQTFGAVAKGLKAYRAVAFAGVIANRVAGAGHARMLLSSLPHDIALLGTLPQSLPVIPERHLGLLQAQELADLPAALDALADALGETAWPMPAPVAFDAVRAPRPPRLLSGLEIAVARDDAFSFLYRANLDCLQAMGAKLRFFAPLTDQSVPAADALYLPGGYPELHAERLSKNGLWMRSLTAFAAAGKPVLAECGGMMPLFDTLVCADGRQFRMAGLLPGSIQMQQHAAVIGLQSLPLPSGELRGHSFHHSRLRTPLAAAFRCTPHPRRGEGERVYRCGSVTASYVHAYFPSCPRAAASLFTP